jgi:transcriptional regulator with XRE-family HTH domain
MKNDTGKYLRRVRADLSKKAGHKLTSLDLAASLGIPRTTYSRYERGGNISIELLRKV